MRGLYFGILSGLAAVILAGRPVYALYGVDDQYLMKDAPRISMDFKDADLADVLKILSQQSGMNFVASSALKEKTINLYLDNVPVDQALERILSANGLVYEMGADSNIFVVKAAPQALKSLITRVYNLKYATVSSSKLNQMLDFSADSEGLSGSSSSSTSSGSDSSSDAKSGILAAITTMLSEDGSVIEDERTNSLIVTDIPSQFLAIEQTIARLDVRVPQVVIEVEMLDVSKKDADKIGVKFGEDPVAFNGGAKPTLFPFAPKALEDPITYTAGTLSYTGLQFTMQFLKTQTDAKSLARPRIMTLSNETAEIRIVTDEAIAVSQQQSSSEGLATSSLEAEREETGVFLRVTPQVNLQTDEITMAIEPKVVQAKDGLTYQGLTFKDPETQGTKSVLRIKNGDTVVIGGLLRNDDANTKTKVPGLSNIPVLGGAFRHRAKSEQQRELVVFITPHIAEDGVASLTSSTAKISQTQDPGISDDRLNAINKEMMLFEKRSSGR